MEGVKTAQGRMMRSPIAIAALVASVSASAGELDGKAISCDNGRQNLEFRGGRVVSWYVWGGGGILGDARIVEDDEPPAYYALTNTVIWSSYIAAGELLSRDGEPSLASTTGYTLDRKTLALEVKEEKSDGKIREWIHQCEVYSSMTDFKAMLEAYRAETQRRIDEQMKDNKI